MTGQNDVKPFARLPKSVLPEHYKLRIKVDLDKLDFQGSCEVNVKVNESCSNILLDSQGLEVSGAELQNGAHVIAASEVKELLHDRRIEMLFPNELPQGPAVLRYSFSGKLGELAGFYRCKTKNEKGEDVYYASTQFEATDARRAFPCWDEPTMKATFEVTLVTKNEFLALSNTKPVEGKDIEDGWRETKFEPTPKMSTYLVCFVVGKFDYVEAFTKSNIRVRAYTPVGRKEEGTFALEVAVKSLDFFEDYFKNPYPLSKCDLISVPDFSMGAMENWGLVTFREECILYDPLKTGSLRKQHIVSTVAHEISHMWFGNLVTMEWWTQLWLKEGFATFMEKLANDTLYPDFCLMMQANCLGRDSALNLDAMDNSHPIEVPVNHPSEADEVFDAISYEKGCAVIGMLHNYLGDESFQKGITLYLNRHAYKNTVTKDLWDALSESSGEPIAEIMDSWVKQMGFPLLSVKRRESGEDCILDITQEKFYSSSENPLRKGQQPLWKVPLVIAVAGQKDTRKLFDGTSLQIELKGAAKASWINLNHNATGVYRVLYDRSMLDALIPAIKDRTMCATDRYTTHSDLVAMVESGYATTKDLLDLSKAYVNETEYTVWCSISIMMAKLEELLFEQPELLEKFHAFGRELYSNIFAQLGWDPKPNESHSTSMLREQVLNKLVSFEDETVLTEAHRRFEAHASALKEGDENNKAVLPADLRKPVYRALARCAHKKPALWDQLKEMHKSADNISEANRISMAMGATKNEDLLLKTLEFVDTEVRSQDAVFVIASVSANSVTGRNLAWAHFVKHFDRYNTQYNSGPLFHRLVKATGEGFCTLEKGKEVDLFLQKNPVLGSERTYKQTVESIETKARWLQRDSEQIREFLKAF